MGKKGQQEVSKKSLQKEANQVVEDQTFGLKNKNKSKKVQQYVQQVQKQVQAKVDQTIRNQQPNKMQQSNADMLRQQKEEEKRAQQLAMLRATLKQPTVPEGDNPKNYPCVFFQYGCCDKGDKCKFSHGEKVEIMTEQQILEEKLRKEQEKLEKQSKQYMTEEMGKLDIFRDMREQILEYRARQKAYKNGTSYDQVLAEIKEQEAERTRTQNRSDLICKHFIQACRENQIGFGWTCPFERQMGYCQYRHFLPLDFELFEKPEDYDADIDYVQVEEEIERKRLAITQGTPVNEETFKVWKAKRVQRRREEAEALEAEAEKKIGLTGKQIFVKGLYRQGGSADVDAEEGGNEEDLDIYLQQYKKIVEEGANDQQDTAAQPEEQPEPAEQPEMAQ